MSRLQRQEADTLPADALTGGWRNGKRATLKMSCPNGFEGSTPSSPTASQFPP